MLHSYSKIFNSRKLRALTTIYESYFQFAYNVIDDIIIRTRNFNFDYNVRTVSILDMFYIIKEAYVGNNVYGKNYDQLVIKAYFRSNPTTVVHISNDPAQTYEIVY